MDVCLFGGGEREVVPFVTKDAVSGSSGCGPQGSNGESERRATAVIL
jgi:hypothetical protein